MKLFDDDDNNVEDITEIKINKDYAKRFEYNKKREDLQRLEEMKKKGLVADDGSDSESESDISDDEGIKSSKNDKKFIEALIKAKNQDPILKQKDVKLFDSDESSDEGEQTKKKEKKKPKKYLKDVMAEQLLEEGPEFEDSEDRKAKRKVKTYSEEQEGYLQEALKALDDIDNGEDVIIEKDSGSEEEEEATKETAPKWDEYFNGELNEDESFLKEFITKKLWLDKDKEKKKNTNSDDIDIEQDEEEIERQEKFEKDFNFRYEEGVGDRVFGHSRQVDGSVRKKDNARKRQRESKEERMLQAEIERKEEVKRLKNVKKKEIEAKLNKIREIAGLDDALGIPLTERDLEEDFDPDEYDKKMKAAFGKEYYDAEEVDPGFGSGSDDEGGELDKPDFEKEDKLLGLPKDWDVCKPGEGFSSEVKKIKKTKAGDGDDEEGDDEGREVEGDDTENYESKRKRKRKMSLKEKMALEKDLDELYKLDYEDTIGDLKTRFKYKTVKGEKFGLSTVATLLLDEKDLNQYVSLKKLAPYRDEELEVHREKKKQMKCKYWEILGELENKDKRKVKRRKEGERAGTSSSVPQEDQKVEEIQEDNGNKVKSRKARRRANQAEFKLSEGRLKAYGKIPSESKKKVKS